MTYPVDGPKVVTQAFGARPEVYSQYGFPGHEGLDLQAALGATIRAVADGYIGPITDSGNYGNAVRVVHPGGWQTTYAHLARVADIHAADVVKAGDVIGYAGATGNATGSHLHMTLKRSGFTYTDAKGVVWPFNIFDPTPYLAPLMTAATIDTLPYIRGAHRRQFDLGYDGGTQTTQVMHVTPSDWLYVKGNQGEYERLGLRKWLGADWIYRYEDTSESPTRFYAHYASEGGAIGAPWFPRHAEIGRWYSTPKFVQHYLKVGCIKQNGGNVVDKLRLMTGPRAVTYPQSGVMVADVITLEWASGEQYDFGRERGNVAFRDATRNFWFIGDVVGREDKPYRKPGCVPLGW